MIDVKTKLLTRIVTVPEGARAIVLVNGKLDCILRPGRHSFAMWGKTLTTEGHTIQNRAFVSAYADAVMAREDLAAEHLVEVKTGASEVAVILRDGLLHSTLRPESRMRFWKDAGPWAVELIDVSRSVEVAPALARRLASLDVSAMVKRVHVEHGQIGLLTVDGVLTRQLVSGAYTFWTVGPQVNVKIVDTREHALDVAGQEILTRDKVSIRVNLVAKYRVVDAERAVTAVKDYAEALYRALQHAFRQSLAAKTLDDLLTRKGEVDGEAAQSVRTEMAKIGLEVGDIAIKDVILPGEMRDILNKVVAAEREAEAQVIRRREETNATRSLLNTARVMAENPVMLRLKELEALEKIADKVQTLTVHNGTKGLLEDIVSLRPAVTAAPERRR